MFTLKYLQNCYSLSSVNEVINTLTCLKHNESTSPYLVRIELQDKSFIEIGITSSNDSVLFYDPANILEDRKISYSPSMTNTSIPYLLYKNTTFKCDAIYRIPFDIALKEVSSFLSTQALSSTFPWISF